MLFNLTYTHTHNRVDTGLEENGPLLNLGIRRHRKIEYGLEPRESSEPRECLGVCGCLLKKLCIIKV